MKILLIKPYWRVVKYVICPPLGILSLAGYLRQNMNPAPEIIVLDHAARQFSMDQVEKFIAKEKPDIVGITGLTYEAPAIKLLAAISKKISPQTPVIGGGPHATVFYDHLLEKTRADVAVLGEGEATFLDLVEHIRDGRDWKGIPGIAYKSDSGEIIKNAPRSLIMDLDSLPFPAWNMVDIPLYSKYGDMNGFLKQWPYMFIFTSRACPYGCIYCHQLFGKKFRARSVASVIEEIKRLTQDHGVKELHIIDDIFNWDIDRAKEICRAIIRENIKVSIAFPNALRGDKLDAELIELLAKAGCYSLTFAIETASPRLQKLLRKFADLDKLDWAISKAYDEGIIPMGFFMMGFPTETREEMEQTIEFACRSKLLKAFFFSVVPFPRTKMFDLFKETYPDQFSLDEEFLDSMHYSAAESVYRKATGINLQAVVQSAYRRFYLDPQRIVRIFRRFPWNRRFLRGFYLGFLATWLGGHKLDAWWTERKRKQAGLNSDPC